MTVSLLMGWGLLALLVLLVVFLVVITLIPGGSGNAPKGRHSPGQGVPVNVFQRGVSAPDPVLAVPEHRQAPADHPGS
jgi:hypothetical protein